MRRLAAILLIALLALSFLSCGEGSDIVLYVADGTPYTETTASAATEVPVETTKAEATDSTASSTGGGEGDVWALISKTTRKFHLSGDCPYAKRIHEENRLEMNVSSVDYLIEQGYSPCSYCAKQYVQKTETTASDKTE